MQLFFPERPSPEADRRLIYTEYLILRILLFFFVGIIMYKVRHLYQLFMKKKKNQKAPLHEKETIADLILHLEQIHTTEYASLEELLTIAQLDTQDQQIILAYIYQEKGEEEKVKAILRKASKVD